MGEERAKKTKEYGQESKNKGRQGEGRLFKELGGQESEICEEKF